MLRLLGKAVFLLFYAALPLAAFAQKTETSTRIDSTAPLVSSARNKIQPKSCSLHDLMDGLRHAFSHGSPALKRYARELLKESTLAIAPEQLRSAFASERDPQMVEALGTALAARTARTRDMSFVKPQLARAVGDSDPAVRAAAVRSLRGMASVEAMAETRSPGYEQLIRDPAPEVRTAVVDNLIRESADVYFGHDRAVSEKAVQVAAAATDWRLASRLLLEVSTEHVGHQTVVELLGLLSSERSEVRAAAAHALGGVPAAESAGARAALIERYNQDAESVVRKAIMESLVRLGMSGSAPTLESLRGIDAAMGKEIDLWLLALKSGLQEWHLLLREKQLLEQQPQKQPRP